MIVDFIRKIWRKRQPALTEKILPSALKQPILPSKFGLALIVLLVLILIWSANHRLNLGYAIGFFLATVFLLSGAITAGQLAKLHLKILPADPVFVGETAYFWLDIYEESNKSRGGFYLSINKQTIAISGILAGKSQRVAVPQATSIRGYQQLDDFSLFSRQPFGFFTSWRWVFLSSKVLVYPKPLGNLPLPYQNNIASKGALKSIAGDEELVGLAVYQNGESLSKVAWKAIGKNKDQKLLSKKFTQPVNTDIVLDYQQIKGDGEQRLSQLCKWIIEAEQNGFSYGLRLPGVEIAPSNGKNHQHKCLKKLALFGKKYE